LIGIRKFLKTLNWLATQNKKFAYLYYDFTCVILYVAVIYFAVIIIKYAQLFAFIIFFYYLKKKAGRRVITKRLIKSITGLHTEITGFMKI